MWAVRRELPPTEPPPVTGLVLRAPYGTSLPHFHDNPEDAGMASAFIQLAVTLGKLSRE